MNLDELDPLTLLAHEWLDLDKSIKDQEKQIKELKDLKDKVAAELTQKVPVGTEIRMPSGGSGVKLMPPRKVFNPELAAKVLPEQILIAISRPVPQAQLATELLAEDFPGLLAQCKKSTGEPSLRRL